MIIFGTRPKTRTVGSGQFYCPVCQAPRQYERKAIKNYFALYFIPLIPLGEGGEFIECQTCGRMFEPSVLDHKPPQKPLDLAGMINRIGDALTAGQPAEYLIRDLTGAGLEWSVARTLVMDQLGDTYNHCEACDLSYAATVEACLVCQVPFGAAPPANAGNQEDNV